MTSPMKFKTNLHMHTGDDPQDSVPYSTFEAIDHGAKNGFSVLAITCHRKAAWTQEYADYAQERGILLIPGIELPVSEKRGHRGRHVIVLGVNKEAEHIHTFEDLERYRNKYPSIFILAPHPYFYGNFSLHWRLDKYIHLFDAIEHSWFYSKMFNRNKRGERAAKRHNLPMVATSDTHFFDFMTESYSIINALEKTTGEIFDAIKKGAIECVSSPRKLFREMIIPEIKLICDSFPYRTHDHRYKKLVEKIERE
jgi:predicted metal-dependent phosphoesterase TrpH